MAVYGRRQGTDEGLLGLTHGATRPSPRSHWIVPRGAEGLVVGRSGRTIVVDWGKARARMDNLAHLRLIASTAGNSSTTGLERLLHGSTSLRSFQHAFKKALAEVGDIKVLKVSSIFASVLAFILTFSTTSLCFLATTRRFRDDEVDVNDFMTRLAVLLNDKYSRIEARWQFADLMTGVWVLQWPCVVSAYPTSTRHAVWGPKEQAPSPPLMLRCWTELWLDRSASGKQR